MTRETTDTSAKGTGGPSDNAQNTSGNRKTSVMWSPPDAYRLLAALRQGLIWLIVAPILGLVATIGYVLWNEPVYDVGAQLMVRFGQELAAPATVSATPSQQVIPMSKRIEDTNAEVQIMKDPSLVSNIVYDMGEDWFYGEGEAVTVLQKIKKAFSDTISKLKSTVRRVLVRIGLLPNISRLDQVVLLLQNSISINPVSRSDVIELSLSYPDPRIGEEIMRRFIAEYFERRTVIYRDTEVEAFFETELPLITKELDTVEATYDAFLVDNQIWSIEDQRGMAVANRDSLLQSLEEADAILAVSASRLEAVDAELARQEEFIPLSKSQRVNPQREELELKRVDLLLELAIERQESGARSLQVRSIETQLAELQEHIDALPETVPGDEVAQANPLIERLISERFDTELLIETTKRRTEALKADIAAVEKELSRLGSLGVQNTRMVRELEALRRAQARFQHGYDDARIASEVSNAQISNVSVIAEPQAGVAPSKPRLKRLLIVALIFSVVAAAGVILIVDALRPKVRNNRDLLELLPAGTLVRAIPQKRGKA